MAGMVPIIGWLSFLLALGYVLGAFVFESLGIGTGTWPSFFVSFGLGMGGMGLTWLGQRIGLVSRFWFRGDR